MPKQETKYFRKGKVITKIGESKPVFVGDWINEAKRKSRQLQQVLGDGSLKVL